ncbi:hypothetical protein [Streptomyces sp. NPDC059460]|uniref:hypothetical protein n=1 Tax=Streptomyces sp. NPDC059460 TaxID=3346840 RepID=UPI0036C40106
MRTTRPSKPGFQPLGSEFLNRLVPTCERFLPFPTGGIMGGDFMRFTGRSIVLTIAGAALAAIGLAAPATADSAQAGVTPSATVTIHHRGDGTQPPAELGNPSEWGVVKIEIPAEGSIGTMGAGNTCQNVTHGRWCYGWEPTTPVGKKFCYSNYIADVQHRTTVRAANVDYHSGWAAKGATSYANVTIGTAYTCYAYYDNA